MHPTTRTGRSLPAVLSVALLALLAACGGSDPTSAEATPEADADVAAGDTEMDPATFPVTVRGAEIPERPERIVSLSATATEMLFAIGAGDRVVATDEYSNHPPEAPTTDLSGFQPNVEAISAFDPDLVVASNDPGELVASLATIDVPTLLLPSAPTIEDAYDQMADLGAATGEVEGARGVVDRMRTEIDEILAGLTVPAGGLTYYHELTPDFHSVSAETFIGDVYRLLGLQSITDSAELDGVAYPQLSPEFIIDADPDVILLADAHCCDVTPGEVTDRPGWDTVSAVRRGAVIVLDEDIASRWGPRIVQLMRDVADELADLDLGS